MSTVESKAAATDAGEQSTAMTKQEPSNKAMIALDGFFGTDKAAVLHNFTGSPAEIWRQMALATAGDKVSKEVVLQRPIEVNRFYAHRVEVTNYTSGEVTDATRVVLLDKDNNIYAFVSEGIAQDLKNIIQAFGMGPYDPPIRVQVVQKETGGGRNVLRLKPV